MFQVLENLPELIRAKFYMTLEMRRLIYDPFFGKINKKKILKADSKIKTSNWMKVDPEAFQLLKSLE